MKILFKKLHPDAVIPKYITSGSSGFDLVVLEDTIIKPKETKLVRTGLAVEIEQGYEIQIRPRSGLSLKSNLIIPNSPGTIDSDYRGEVCVIFKNIAEYSETGFDENTFFFRKGNRMAQGVVCAVNQAEIEEVESLDSTERGTGGFGSSGK